ncbi:uncharacterized protein C18orf63 homolog isoform X2 [Narcine bancroftii]|uniref:uncharacterized protein C18orf63 homolog isoform X2 n=1 Tax=Narcine bancroftii TaxID=1343680 RepID=UPI0038310736
MCILSHFASRRAHQSSGPDKMKEDCRFQSLFFISLPDLRKLCGTTVILNCDDADAKTLQTLKCRELLFLYPEVLAAPGEHKEVRVIMPIPFYKAGNIQVFVHKHRGKMDVPQRVIPAVLQICLSFTLVTRLAPDWNKAGHLLIHGMELNASENQVCISVEASTIRLPLAKIEDFDISTGVLKNFSSKRNAVIPKYFIASNWCFVLPSMKKGQIVSISHEIPQHCPFQSYEDFQKHWKNMYGYNLPSINSDMALYYTVNFKLIGEKLFTYPFCCIRSEPVQFFPRVDLESVLMSFLSDLKTKFPNLCGLPIKITSKPYYTTNELNFSQIDQTRPPNLTPKPIFRTVLTKIPAPTFSAKKSSICLADGNQKSIDNEHKIDLKTSLESESKDGSGLDGSTFRSAENPKVAFYHSHVGRLRTDHQMEVYSGSINHAYRNIPIFKNKLLKQDKEFNSSRINVIKAKQNENSRKLLALNSSNANIKVNTPKNIKEHKCRNKEEELFDKIQNQKSSSYTSVGKPSTNQVQSTSSDTVKNTCKDTLFLKSSTRIIKPGATALEAFGNFQEQSSKSPKFEDKSAIGLKTCTQWIENQMENQHKQVLGGFDVKNPFKEEKQTHFQHLSSRSLTGKNFSDKGTEKRKCEEKVPDSKPKKPKTKPVIQDVDMEKQAKYNQLSKVNSITLQSWLKRRGVSVRTRDRKEQLVSKIMEFIKSPQN